MRNWLFALLFVPGVLLAGPPIKAGHLGNDPMVADFVAKRIPKNRLTSVHVGMGYWHWIGRLSSGKIVRLQTGAPTDESDVLAELKRLAKRTRRPSLQVRLRGGWVKVPQNRRLIDWYAAYLIRNDMTKKAKRSITYTINHRTYYIDWDTMEQVRRDDSKKRRKVRFYPSK